MDSNRRRVSLVAMASAVALLTACGSGDSGEPHRRRATGLAVS